MDVQSNTQPSFRGAGEARRGLVDFVDVSWSADLVVRIALDFNSPFVSEVRKQLKKAQRHEDLKSFGMLDGAGAEDICLRAAGALRRLGLGSR